MSRTREKYKFIQVPVNQILMGPYTADEDLVESMAETDGVRDPIKLRPLPPERRVGPVIYEVVNGRRRLDSAIQNGFNGILAIIDMDMNDIDFHLEALIGNSGRPNEMDEAEHIEYLLAQGLSQVQIAKMVRYTPGVISQRLSLTRKLIKPLQSRMKLLKDDHLRIDFSTGLELTKLPKAEQELYVGEPLKWKKAHEIVRQYQAEATDSGEIDIPNTHTLPGLFVKGEAAAEALANGLPTEVDWNGIKVEVIIRRV